MVTETTLDDLARNGRTQAIKAGDITLNCLDTVPLAPAMSTASKNTQKTQQGDYVAIEGTGEYEDTTVTCVYVKADYDAIDTARANITTMSVSLSTDFTGDAMVNVSEGPTLTVAGVSLPTMSVTFQWTTTKKPSAN